MVDNSAVVERYGVSMDDEGASIVDTLEQSLTGSYWEISNCEGIVSSANRHIRICSTNANAAPHKVDSMVFKAFEDANLSIIAIDSGIGSENEVQVWFNDES